MANPGDRVQIKTKKGTEEGVLIPSSEKNVVLIKLDNGYNLGFEKKSITSTKILKKSTSPTNKKQKITKNKSLPTIAILHTGGTIASKVDYKTGGVTTDFSPEELVSLFPELKEIANIESELISQMWSDDLRFAHFTLMAKAIEKYVKKGVKGIIVGIGTDNLAVASAALSFMVESSPVPIVLVGSQKSSDRGSSDAGMNLICAAEFVSNSDFGGVGVCMHASAHDQSCNILPGTKTVKLHSSRRDAFKVVNEDSIASIDYKTRKITFCNSYRKQAPLKLKPKMEDKVGLLKVHVNMFSEQFEFFKGYKGLVIEGTGLGHTPGQSPNKETAIHKKMYPAIKKVIDSGCVVVMTTQCIFGGVNLNVYSKGRDLQEIGVISGKDMLANTALVKLSWLLANEKDVKNLIGKNLRGEINASLKYSEEFM
ncbi:Glu-tRNA(Gln) amidotransferase subunit GatD [Candidatus Woesearchaeota archaeon]|jgi:glutamyl-tRNA(Gln) amidotransferase subunit D|nr:Glu-tRNA(Gln) amidotransferase subunit GatD [Candidatus Woesearchaeota archaeon]MBT4150526.1 Glu-tRNA(Gln) amidotransferase subunit GatD [Candidatus Woesearchaeota archaeon]MBT4247167.1 Glu-tRNA(Gln) amidotransferase subunit GatD [Candidatus Woesearchaeota archaeon]MBT4434608.1 Glu-tRNA(Gln) amidotransferase subunit GatD [Candidatus Woesearchaeota archaeon]MBT7332541.1 Glu-tRNA(Gln) amidotransferase subunit GatD [Candidatus Woesearchaeota archaeon]